MSSSWLLLKLRLWVQRSSSQYSRCMLNITSSKTSKACCSLLLLLSCNLLLLHCKQQLVLLLLLQLLHCSRSTSTQGAASQAQVADPHKPAQQLLHLPLLLHQLCRLLHA
jgi:hypothetical protein